MTHSELLYLLIGIVAAAVVFVFQKIKLNTLKNKCAESESKSLEKDELMGYARNPKRGPKRKLLCLINLNMTCLLNSVIMCARQ